MTIRWCIRPGDIMSLLLEGHGHSIPYLVISTSDVKSSCYSVSGSRIHKYQQISVVGPDGVELTRVWKEQDVWTTVTEIESRLNRS